MVHVFLIILISLIKSSNSYHSSLITKNTVKFLSKGELTYGFSLISSSNKVYFCETKIYCSESFKTSEKIRFRFTRKRISNETSQLPDQNYDYVFILLSQSLGIILG